MDENNWTNIEHMKKLTELGNELSNFSAFFNKNKDLIEDLKSLRDDLENIKTHIDNHKEFVENMSNHTAMMISYLDTNKEILKPELIDNIDKIVAINKLFSKKLANTMDEEFSHRLNIKLHNIKENTEAIKISSEKLTDSINRIENMKIYTKSDVNKNKNNLIKAVKLIRDVRDEIENLAYLDGTLEEYEKSKIKDIIQENKEE